MSRGSEQSTEIFGVSRLPPCVLTLLHMDCPWGDYALYWVHSYWPRTTRHIGGSRSLVPIDLKLRVIHSCPQLSSGDGVFAHPQGEVELRLPYLPCQSPAFCSLNHSISSPTPSHTITASSQGLQHRVPGFYLPVVGYSLFFQVPRMAQS